LERRGVVGLGSGRVVLAQGMRYCAKISLLSEHKTRWCITVQKIERSTYRELNRGFVSGIERLEKMELLGEK
jgi:hypothetical protein